MSDADPGALICPVTHKHRVHPLGGGMFVCFACFTRLLLAMHEPTTARRAA